MSAPPQPQYVYRAEVVRVIDGDSCVLVTKAIDKIERDLRDRFTGSLVFGNLEQGLREVALMLRAV